MDASSFSESIAGLLLGTAVGDALGLPAEGLAPARIERRWGNEWRMRLFWKWGMISDDTEHTLLVAQSLLACPDNAAAFQRRLASKLRWWFLALPAGVGLGTARACLKLWCGIPPTRSGVRSAGNGPAMRVAIIGAFFAHEPAKRREFTVAATRLTHVDPRAEIAAQAVAEAAAWAIRKEKSGEAFLRSLLNVSDAPEWRAVCQRIADAYKSNLSVREFALCLGLRRGVTGYAFHTVPVGLYAWLRHHEDFRKALTEAISCGGDTDTVGAIVGALVGASVGKANIPPEWLSRIVEWPRSPKFIQQIATRLVDAAQSKRALEEVGFFWPAVIPRNLLFLAIVLAHGFRRLFPPY